MGLCPQLLSTGACGDSSCPHKHDVKICLPCGVVCTSDSIYQAHLNGKRHRNKVSGVSTIYGCSVCNVNVSSVKNWAVHIAAKAHLRRAMMMGVNPAVEPAAATTPAGYEHCDVCDLNVVQYLWAGHLKSPLHSRKEKFVAFKAAFAEGEKDKNGVTVSNLEGGIDFGIVEPVAARGEVRSHVSIRSTVPSSRIVIQDFQFTSAKTRNVTTSFSASIANNVRDVRYGQEFHITVAFKQPFLGHYEDRLEIVFEDTMLRARFIIVRTVRAVVGNATDYNLLRPVAPFVPRKRTQRDAEQEVIPGEVPDALAVIPWVVPLPKANIPQSMAQGLANGSVSELVQRVRRTYLPSVLRPDTYGRHFKTLIWVEEMRSEQDLEIYDISDAHLELAGRSYTLPVPGLAEKRPSVLVGDSILVHAHGTSPGKWFEGRVHFVAQTKVGLRFHPSFRASASTLFNVRFKLNRFPLRRQHQALDTAFNEPRILFPEGPAPALPNVNALAFYNADIGGNPSQAAAVKSIVALTPRSPPFVVFGPPGTGKTVTIVEAIRQVLRASPTARVLACAPSNSAADLIASRLTMLDPSELFRMVAPSRSPDLLPSELERFTFSKFAARQSSVHASVADAARRHFSVPPMAQMRRFRVVVCTCVSASIPYGIGMPRGHFTHIFVDEAGQASEPEVMIPVKTMADSATKVVLSGDHKQLGPIIRSGIARALGLETSFLERLMKLPLYDPVQGHGRTVVKLVKNFRSHSAILKFPNERFYAGDLVTSGSPAVLNAYLNWGGLPSPKFPIVFHAMHGKDDREASSPSFFNISEVLQIKNYVQQLRADRRFRTTEDDIGIVAPYHAQCKKIRTALAGFAEGVKVGSVEEFQGQERKVIIISTVRSSREFVEYDLRHTLGFVANPRRFNVAVTRAKALLIIIGDPNVLSLDPLWRSFLTYIHGNGGWTGQGDIPWDPLAPVREDGGYDRELRDLALANMNDFARRVEEFTLGEVTGDWEDVQEADANADRPWQEVE